VHRFITVIRFVCILSLCAFGVSADPNQPIASKLALPMLLTTLGQTQIILHDMQPTDHRLVLEIRSPDVTSMPSRSALHLAFDTQITEVSKPNAPMPLRLETAVTDQQISFFLARDPFAFPQPWSYTVAIKFNKMPQTGSVTLEDLPPQNVIYPSPLPTMPTPPLLGT